MKLATTIAVALKHAPMTGSYFPGLEVFPRHAAKCLRHSWSESPSGSIRSAIDELDEREEARSRLDEQLLIYTFVEREASLSRVNR
jgi:hypothetical protein